MTRSRCLLLGEQARCSILLSKLRPSLAVANAFPNPTSTQRLDDLVANRLERKERRGLVYEAVFFSSESIPDVELSAARRFVVVVEQGPDAGLWDSREDNVNSAGLPPLESQLPMAATTEIDDAIFRGSGSRAEDIAMVRNQGFDVDDDNKPVPENIPSPSDEAPDNNSLYDGQS